MFASIGVARNLDWSGPKMEKFCDIILVTFFGDDFFEVRFLHNQLKNPQFGQIT